MADFWIEALKKLSGPLVIALALLFVVPVVAQISVNATILIAVLAAIVTMAWIFNKGGVETNELILFGIALGAIIILSYLFR